MLEDSDDKVLVALERWGFGYITGSDSMALDAANDVEGVLEHQTAFYSRSLLNALYHRSRGRKQSAAAAADSAALLFEDIVQQRTSNPRAYAALETAYALQGLPGLALRAGEEAVRLLPVERDAMWGPEYLMNLARIHALLGDYDSAADVVAGVLSAPSEHSLESVLLDPVGVTPSGASSS